MSELNFSASIRRIEEHRYRLFVEKCPFRQHKSASLCALMRGLLGGLILMAHGYCKFVELSGPDKEGSPCCVDMYTALTPEAENKVGLEYSKKTISLLQGTDDAIVVQQRQARRKLALGLFSSMTVSLQEDSSGASIAESYMEALSCIPEIKIAGLYLREHDTGRFSLVSHYGLPEDIVPQIRAIGNEANADGSYDESLVRAVEEFDAHKKMIGQRLSVRSFSSFRLHVQDRLVGVLNIGWKTSFPLSLEMRNAISDSCSLLATVMDNMRLYVEQERAHFRLEKAYIDSIALINNLVSSTDQFLGNHASRVAELAEAIAAEMGLAQDEINVIYQAGLIHDIGKTKIPPEVLNKPDALTEEEFELIKTHPIVGASLVSPVPQLACLVPAIMYHHERLDGSGYPEGLTGGSIPLHARIIAVADTFDAMTRQRAYRDAFDEEAAVDELINYSSIRYDTAVVKACIAVLNDRKAGLNAACAMSREGVAS